MATQTIKDRPATLDGVLRGRYLSVTSFKRDGTGVATPVWFVSDGRRLFALTDLHSGKIRRNPPGPARLDRVVPGGRQAARRADPGVRAGVDRNG